MARIDEILALDEPLILPELSNHVFDRMERVGFDDLTAAERLFRVVEEVLMEVNNGGFEQYFLNSSGDHAPQAALALEQIGAPSTASMLRRAMALFGPEGPSPRRPVRQAEVKSLSKNARTVLAALDEEFSRADDAAAREMPFVLANRAAFQD